MAVAIRLTRVGATKRPAYRVIAIDKRRSRDGRALEILGFYDPLTEPATVQLDTDRINAWIGNGAQPSDTVVKLLRQADAAAKGETTERPKRATRGSKPSKKALAKAAAAEAAAAEPAAAEAETAAEPAAAEVETAAAEPAETAAVAEPEAEIEGASPAASDDEAAAPAEATAESDTPEPPAEEPTEPPADEAPTEPPAEAPGAEPADVVEKAPGDDSAPESEKVDA